MTKPIYPVHFYPWYVHDWRQSRARMRLSLMGKLAYRELLDQCYLDGSLPDDEVLLAKMADIPLREFQRVWPEVKKCFERRDDGNLHHSKVDVVLEEQERWKRQRSIAGRASGESRRTSVERSLNGRSTAAERSLNVPYTNTNTNTNIPSFAPDLAFEKLYSRHPKKKERAFAETTFSETINVPEPEKLFALIDTRHQELCLTEDWTKNKGRFAPKLADWISDRGWTEGVEPPPKPYTDEQRAKDEADAARQRMQNGQEP